MDCSRPGTICLLADRVKKAQTTKAAVSIAATELVIDKSSLPRPGTSTGGKGKTLWIRNWLIGSMAGIEGPCI